MEGACRGSYRGALQKDVNWMSSKKMTINKPYPRRFDYKSVLEQFICSLSSLKLASWVCKNITHEAIRSKIRVTGDVLTFFDQIVPHQSGKQQICDTRGELICRHIERQNHSFPCLSHLFRFEQKLCQRIYQAYLVWAFIYRVKFFVNSRTQNRKHGLFFWEHYFTRNELPL